MKRAAARAGSRNGVAMALVGVRGSHFRLTSRIGFTGCLMTGDDCTAVEQRRLRGREHRGQ